MEADSIPGLSVTKTGVKDHKPISAEATTARRHLVRHGRSLAETGAENTARRRLYRHGKEQSENGGDNHGSELPNRHKRLQAEPASLSRHGRSQMEPGSDSPYTAEPSTAREERAAIVARDMGSAFSAESVTEKWQKKKMRQDDTKIQKKLDDEYEKIYRDVRDCVLQ